MNKTQLLAELGSMNAELRLPGVAPDAIVRRSLNGLTFYAQICEGGAKYWLENNEVPMPRSHVIGLALSALKRQAVDNAKRQFESTMVERMMGGSALAEQAVDEIIQRNRR